MAAATAAISGAYSFLDVQVAFAGPGLPGSVTLSDPGYSGEGIKISMVGEKDVLTVGADGAGMHSLIASKAAKATVSLLKTGPGNAMLAQAYNYQTQSSAYVGQNIFTITNPISGDSITLQGGAFAKFPDIAYATEGGLIEWEFLFTQADFQLGNGFQNTGI